MKTAILTTLFISVLSLSLSSQAAEHCRLSIENFAKMIDSNSSLADRAVEKLAKKGITLIDDEELQEGDFQITDLIRGDWNLKMKRDGFSTWAYTPYTEGKFTRKLTLNPFCTGMCAPILSEQGDLIGKTYHAPGYQISVKGTSKMQSLKKGLQFKYSVRDYEYGADFVGSQEQAGLTMAIVRDMPKCSQLLKLQAEGQ